MTAFLEAVMNPFGLTILAILLAYFVLRWTCTPRLRDSYFEIDEAKFYELRFVGQHSSKIQLDDIPQCIAEMRRVFRSNVTRRISNRKKQLHKLKLLIEENEDQIVEAIKSDLGRHPLLGASYDVYPVLGEIKKFLANIDAWSAPQRMSPSLLTFPSYDCHVVEPFGTVFVNGIWNFPFQLALSPIAGAIAAGNNVIFHPCNTAPKSASLLSDLLHKYMDSKFVQCIGHPTIANGDDYTVTDKILESKFDFIFFTGSSNGGKYIMRQAAKFLTPVVLELGGKNPVIIDDSADLALAARQVISARMINCGQQCISPDFVLCPQSQISTFVVECTKVISKWYRIGEAMVNDLGESQAKLVNDQQLKRVEKMLGETSGKVVFGGKCDAKTRMFEPTIVLLGSTDELKTKEETFGPILWIAPVKGGVKESVAFINEHCEKSLSLYLFSKSAETQNFVMHNTSSGGMQINGVLTYAAHGKARFGGVGGSGMGAYHGKHSFDAFSHLKPVVQSYVEFPFAYPPYGAAWKRKMLKWVF